MSTNSLYLECELTIDDAVAWNYYYLQNTSRWKINWILIRFIFLPIMALFFLATTIFLITSIIMGLGWDTIFNGIIGVIIGGSGFFYALNVRRIRLQRVKAILNKTYAGGKNAELGIHKYTISLEGIHDIIDLDDTKIKWDAIEKVVQINEHLLIVERPNKAIIIPRHAFPDDAAFNGFAQGVKDIFQAAQKSA